MSTDKELKLPAYIKAPLIFLGIVALIAALYIAQAIIVPLIFAIIVAILLHPVVNFFVDKKINRLLAIIITLILTILVFAAFGLLLFSQASRFADSWPILVEKFSTFFKDGVSWASSYFDVNHHIIEDWIAKTKIEIFNAGKAALGHTLYNIGNGLVILFLIPVYIFLILFYHPILIEFIRRIFSKSDQSQVSEIITQTKTVIVKLICDHIESLKPWGFLLGDSMPSLLKIKPLLKKKNPKL